MNESRKANSNNKQVLLTAVNTLFFRYWSWVTLKAYGRILGLLRPQLSIGELRTALYTRVDLPKSLHLRINLRC